MPGAEEDGQPQGTVETALKIARHYHVNRDESQRIKFIARKGSYHGVSLGALAVNSSPWIKREVYQPILPQGVLFAPQPLPYRCELGGTTPSECAIRCADAVEEMVLREGPDTIAAIIAEPVSSSAGVAVPGPEYWPRLREICDKYGMLLIADEIVCGFGRTGKMFGVEHWAVVPDLMTVAKGITSGYEPVGACIAREHVYEAFKGGPDKTFMHGYTYSCHPAGAAAGLANLEIIEREELIENSARMGRYLLDQLMALNEHPTVGDVRGLGLFCALDLVKDKATKEPLASVPGAEKLLRDKMAELGMLTRASRQLFITPPLTVDREDIDRMVEIADGSLSYMEKKLGLS
jgi:adenosylmethionine-8-amino-7-oxononanoate aminotransferase